MTCDMSELGNIKVASLVCLDASSSGTFSECQNIAVAVEEARAKQSAPLSGLEEEQEAMELVTGVRGAETEPTNGELGSYILLFS